MPTTDSLCALRVLLRLDHSPTCGATVSQVSHECLIDVSKVTHERLTSVSRILDAQL